MSITRRDEPCQLYVDIMDMCRLFLLTSSGSQVTFVSRLLNPYNCFLIGEPPSTIRLFCSKLTYAEGSVKPLVEQYIVQLMKADRIHVQTDDSGDSWTGGMSSDN